MLGCLRAVELTAASASVVHTSREACSEERLTRQLFRFCQWKRKRGKGIAGESQTCSHACSLVHKHCSCDVLCFSHTHAHEQPRMLSAPPSP